MRAHARARYLSQWPAAVAKSIFNSEINYNSEINSETSAPLLGRAVTAESLCARSARAETQSVASGRLLQNN